MAFSPTDSRLYGDLFSTTEMAAIFSDESAVQRMLQVEAALARVQARLGIIPPEAGARINTAAQTFQPDMDALAASTARVGFPVIELVRQLRAAAGPQAADYVHYGATTQDIMDTARVLQIRQALTELGAMLKDCIRALADLAGAHTATLMVARTHSQQALPTTFGLKTAGWLAPLLRHHDRLAELRARVLVVQFGGAAGTLAALGDRGLEVQAALATELGLGTPLMPWHTQRDSFTEAAGWLSLLTGSLGKMAQDVILLGQSEIGEVRESADTTRGASSTMPQKRNPVVSEIILACARTNASLVGTMHGAMAHEHERGTHGWQVEWLVLPQMFALAAAALTHGLDLSRQLVVDRARMAANVAAANGLILAEAAAFTLGVHMPRAEAKRIVREACDIALRDGRHLIDVLAEMTSAPVAWERIRSEADYLGEAAALTARVLQTSKEIES